MQQYQCQVCGYIYDPAQGDPDNNVPPNTPFDTLPREWVCPICGASQDQFKPVE
jgi:rubredoxin